jgi:hypothetical protein
MASKTFTSGEVLTAADTNTYLNNGGLVLVGTRTFASGSGGYISYSDAFTSTYTNYRIVYNNIICSGGAETLRFGLYDGSAYNTNGMYATRFQIPYNTTTFSGVVAANNAAEISLGSVGDPTNGCGGIIELEMPFLSTKTGIQFNGMDTRSGGNGCIYGSGHNDSSTSWKGFRMGGGITSGQFSVYGYRLG